MRNKHLYPKHWKELSLRCREQAGWRCEGCSVAQGTERISRRGNLYSVRLAACHMNHEERNQPEAELLALCEICHWWHDFTQWQLEQWRTLEALKHARLITPKRITQARDRIYAQVMVEHGHPGI